MKNDDFEKGPEQAPIGNWSNWSIYILKHIDDLILKYKEIIEEIMNIKVELKTQPLQRKLDIQSELNRIITPIQEKISDLNLAIAVIKAKSAVIGAVIGFGGSIVVVLLAHFLRRYFPAV